MSKNPLTYDKNEDITSRSPAVSRNFARNGSVIDGLPSIRDHETFGTKRSVDV